MLRTSVPTTDTYVRILRPLSLCATKPGYELNRIRTEQDTNETVEDPKTPLGTEIGTPWDGLEEAEKKCLRDGSEADQCQFHVCWEGTATLGEWVVGAPSGFKVANMLALRDSMYWWERDGRTNRLCLGGPGATDNTCANQKCSNKLDGTDDDEVPYYD